MADIITGKKLVEELQKINGVVSDYEVFFEDDNGDLHPVDVVTTAETEDGTIIVLANHG